MANINIPFNCEYESINITVKCPIEGTDKEEQVIIAQLKKDNEDWIFCTPGSIVSKNVKILNNEGSYEVIDSNGNFKGKIIGNILSPDGDVIVNVTDNSISTKDLEVLNNTTLNNVTINGKLTLKNGNDIIKLGESSVLGDSSILVLDDSEGDNMGIVLKNKTGVEFLGFSKENNMFEIRTGSNLTDNKVTGGQFGDLKARTIIAEDIMLGNKDKGEQVINLHDVITGDGKGSAHIAVNSLTTVHHSSVFHTAVSYDTGFANEASKILDSLIGDIKTTYLDEKLGGIKDGQLTDKYSLSQLQSAVEHDWALPGGDLATINSSNSGETYNQHWLTINETAKNPQFKWWVASEGNYSDGPSCLGVNYKNIFSIKKEGIDVKGDIMVHSGNSTGETPEFKKLDYNFLTNLYTKAEVESKIGSLKTDLLGGAVEALDTLKELGDALNNDAGFASTLTAKLANKANLTDVYSKTEVDNALDNLPNTYTKSEVENKIDLLKADLLGGASGALDTLKELGNALNNDADFASTLTSKLATKANSTNVYSKSEVENKIGSLKTEVNNALDNLPDTYTKTNTYSKSEVENKIGSLKTEVNNALDDLPDTYTKTDTYSKSEVENKIGSLKNDTYSKSEVENKIGSLKTDLLGGADGALDTLKELGDALKETSLVSRLTNTLSKKADKTDVYTKTEAYAKTEVNSELAKKADKTNVHTKTEVNSELAKKANKTDVHTKDEANAYKIFVSLEMEKRADISTLENYAKLNENYVDFDGNIEVMDEVKAGRFSDGVASLEKGVLNVTNISVGDITNLVQTIKDLKARVLELEGKH